MTFAPFYSAKIITDSIPAEYAEYKNIEKCRWKQKILNKKAKPESENKADSGFCFINMAQGIVLNWGLYKIPVNVVW